MTAWEIREEPYDGPAAHGLIAAVQLEYVARYGGPDASPIDVVEFTPPRGRFYVGYLDGVAVASGGVRRNDEHGMTETIEIKRMYVVPEARGRGLSRLMLAAMEDAACEMGARRVVLETGLVQPEAISLYETSGYERIDGYGYHKDDPLSLSFAKTLTG